MLSVGLARAFSVADARIRSSLRSDMSPPFAPSSLAPKALHQTCRLPVRRVSGGATPHNSASCTRVPLMVRGPLRPRLSKPPGSFEPATLGFLTAFSGRGVRFLSGQSWRYISAPAGGHGRARGAIRLVLALGRGVAVSGAPTTTSILEFCNYSKLLSDTLHRRTYSRATLDRTKVRVNPAARKILQLLDQLRNRARLPESA